MTESNWNFVIFSKKTFFPRISSVHTMTNEQRMNHLNLTALLIHANTHTLTYTRSQTFTWFEWKKRKRERERAESEEVLLLFWFYLTYYSPDMFRRWCAMLSNQMCQLNKQSKPLFCVQHTADTQLYKNIFAFDLRDYHSPFATQQIDFRYNVHTIDRLHFSFRHVLMCRWPSTSSFYPNFDIGVITDTLANDNNFYSFSCVTWETWK